MVEKFVKYADTEPSEVVKEELVLMSVSTSENVTDPWKHRVYIASFADWKVYARFNLPPYGSDIGQPVIIPDLICDTHEKLSDHKILLYMLHYMVNDHTHGADKEEYARSIYLYTCTHFGSDAVLKYCESMKNISYNGDWHPMNYILEHLKRLRSFAKCNKIPRYDRCKPVDILASSDTNPAFNIRLYLSL